MGRFQPGPRHGDLGLAEAADEGARAAAVPVADNIRRAVVSILDPRIAWAGQRIIQFASNEFLDEGANAIAHPALDRVKPVVEKVGGGVGCRLKRISRRGNVGHGVVSVPALQRRVIRG